MFLRVWLREMPQLSRCQGEINGIVFLGASPNHQTDGLKSRSLFIVAREDRNDSGPEVARNNSCVNLSPSAGRYSDGMRNDSVSEATLELFDLACNSDLGRVVGYSEVDQEIA